MTPAEAANLDRVRADLHPMPANLRLLVALAASWLPLASWGAEAASAPASAPASAVAASAPAATAPGAGAAPASASGAATLAYSADPRYETDKGEPMQGTPYLCRAGVVTEVTETQGMAVEPGREIAVTQRITWTQRLPLRAVCAPFVSFVPEPGGRYVVVNERMGMKRGGFLWRPPAMQTCQVSVYRLRGEAFEAVPTRPVPDGACVRP